MGPCMLWLAQRALAMKYFFGERDDDELADDKRGEQRRIVEVVNALDMGWCMGPLRDFSPSGHKMQIVIKMIMR